MMTSAMGCGSRGQGQWVIGISKNYFDLGAPFAPALHANIELLQHAVKLRNRVAHNSTKSREEFKRAARKHLGLNDGQPLSQGYTVGDLLLSPAKLLFGQEARDKAWPYFLAYAMRFLRLSGLICPER